VSTNQKAKEGKRRQKKAMQQGKKHEPFPITGEGAWASKEKLI
jgi:hypothetical protein